MEQVKDLKLEATEKAFYTVVCEMASRDIKDFQACSKLNNTCSKMKDEYKTFQLFTNYKYAVMERKEAELGCDDGITLAKCAKEVLTKLCETRELLKVDFVVPWWNEKTQSWGWRAVY